MATTVSTSASFAKAAAKIRKYATLMQQQHVPTALRMIAEEIMTDVKASAPGHGVPVDTGALRSTGMVTQIAPTEVELSFGGAAADYALIQHERLDYVHTVGEARYLVRGLERWTPGGSRAIAALKINADAGIKAAAR